MIAWRKTVTDIEQTQLDADAAQDALANEQNPFAAEAANFMEKSWVDAKANIVRMLFQLNSAYQYYSLNDVPLRLDDFSVFSLEYSATSLLSLYAQTKINFGSQPSNIIKKAD